MTDQQQPAAPPAVESAEAFALRLRGMAYSDFLAAEQVRERDVAIRAAERAPLEERIKELEAYIDAWEHVGRSLYQIATGKTIEQFGAHEIGEVERVVTAFVQASPLARAQRAEAALEKYGQHLVCGIHTVRRCTCGLDEVLAAHRESSDG